MKIPGIAGLYADMAGDMTLQSTSTLEFFSCGKIIRELSPYADKLIEGSSGAGNVRTQTGTDCETNVASCF
jgi:hypothetical protein